MKTVKVGAQGDQVTKALPGPKHTVCCKGIGVGI